MELDITDTQVDGWTVVTVAGEVDVAAGPELREELVPLIEGGAHRLVIDLEPVDFIDSTGLGVLVGAVRRARAADGDVRLVCTNPRILKIFGVTGLDQVFVIAATVDEAVAAAAPQG
jgi:anti-sigma B factor antagonist